MHWLMLRGLTREQGHWGELPAMLAEAFPEHRFHTPDLPGTGIRHHETSPRTIAGIRASLAHHVRDIPPPYGLLGLSLGAMVALDWAQQAPEGQVQRLVLINPSSRLSPPWQRMRPGTWPRLPMLARGDVCAREREILRLSSNRPVSDDMVGRWCRIQRQHPVTATNAMAQLLAAAHYRPACRRPGAATLVLASHGDRLVHWHCSRALARRWQWPLKLHPDAGHDLPLDDPQWLVRQLREFLGTPA